MNLLKKQSEVICFSEHWLTDNVINGVTLCNYVLANQFCRSYHKRGGVYIFVLNQFKL